MSRVGKKPIPIPPGVDIKFSPGSLEVKGPMGSMQQQFPSCMTIEVDEKNKVVNVMRPNEEKHYKALHGLTRSLIANAVAGVVNNFEKSLTIVGTGYNAKLKGKHLEIQVGFCLPISVMIPEGLKAEVPAPNKVLIKGCDKQLVGQFAANIRKIRLPECYKGKGIRYTDEVIKLKATKSVGGSAKV